MKAILYLAILLNYYPAPLYTLKDLLDASTYVIEGRAISFHQPAKTSLDSVYIPMSEVLIKVENIISGDLDTNLISIQYLNTLCPKPPRFELNTTQLIFIHHSEAGNYSTGRHYGVKNLDNIDYGIYLSRINEYLAIKAKPNSSQQEVNNWVIENLLFESTRADAIKNLNGAFGYHKDSIVRAEHGTFYSSKRMKRALLGYKKDLNKLPKEIKSYQIERLIKIIQSNSNIFPKLNANVHAFLYVNSPLYNQQLLDDKFNDLINGDRQHESLNIIAVLNKYQKKIDPDILQQKITKLRKELFKNKDEQDQKAELEIIELYKTFDRK